MKTRDKIKSHVRGEVGKTPVLVLVEVGPDRFSTFDGQHEYTKKQIDCLPADAVIIIDSEDSKL